MAFRLMRHRVERSAQRMPAMLRGIAFLAGAAAASSISAWPARAEGTASRFLGDAPLEYTALVRVRLSGQALRGRLYARPGMQRHEYTHQQQVLILRFDLGRAWTLDRRTRTYRETPLRLVVGGLSSVLYRPSLEIVREETETIRALRLRRWRFTTRPWAGIKRTGIAWTDTHGVIRKVTASTLSASLRSDMVYEVRSLTAEPQPYQRFTIPEGYRLTDEQPRWPVSALPSGQPLKQGRTTVAPQPMSSQPVHSWRHSPAGPSSTSSRKPGDTSLESLFSPRK